jgi:uncharacterized membrane protein YgdD (TMEM256/DUF423 family)
MDGDTIRKAAAICGATGVAVGAFGAHALKSTLTARGTAASFTTGVQYHLIHAAALLALSGAADASKRDFGTTAKCWMGGVALFSGSIYGVREATSPTECPCKATSR